MNNCNKFMCCMFFVIARIALQVYFVLVCMVFEYDISGLF